MGKALDSFVPLNYRVLVEPFEVKEVSNGGIILPDSAKELPIDGIVRKVWRMNDQDKIEKRSPSVNVGDQVLFQKYGGTLVILEDEKYQLIREEELHGVFDG